MRILQRAAWLLLALVGAGVHASSDRAATPQVAAQLVASVDAVHAGEEILLGVHQRIIPHRHTYWSNPGDSGISTTIAWDLPPGASADAKPGSRFPVRATVDWLVCKEDCIPQLVELRLSLPVVAADIPGGRGSPLIDKALASLPVASPWNIGVERDGKNLLLRVAAPDLAAADVADIWFYPAQWGRVAHGAEQSHQFVGDRLDADRRSAAGARRDLGRRPCRQENTVVATPCTAPFMGAALGYAVTQPPAVLLEVFLSLGLGLALPFLLLSTWPPLRRCLPRPGAWMEKLKQALAFAARLYDATRGHGPLARHGGQADMGTLHAVALGSAACRRQTGVGDGRERSRPDCPCRFPSTLKEKPVLRRQFNRIAIAAGGKIANPSTKPYGCTIKYAS